MLMTWLVGGIRFKNYKIEPKNRSENCEKKITNIFNNDNNLTVSLSWSIIQTLLNSLMSACQTDINE